ncbi:MAG: hypothetical protein ACKVUT_09070 [Gaiella sp.]
MSLAVASFSSATSVAGPNRAPRSLSLTKMALATLGVTELREK